MPLPLFLVGGVVAVGAWGIKKFADAAGDLSDAKEINEDAKSIYASAKNSLDRSRERTQNLLEALGRRKVKLYKDGIIPFVVTFSRIKDVDFHEIDVWDDLSIGDLKNEILQVREIALKMEMALKMPKMEEVLGGGAAALGSGTLVGMATYGSVGLLGAASTGTPIIGLSGVAATNATLAWLGGGSLAAGGLGMAGGTAVLGGIAVAPMLLVGGLILASKAEEAKENAQSNHAKASAAAKAMKDAEFATGTIGRRAAEVDRTLRRLDEDFLAPDLEYLRALVGEETDYRHYSRADKERVCRVVSIAVTTKNLLEAPLLDEEGAITREIRQTLRRTRKFMDDLRAMQHPGAPR